MSYRSSSHPPRRDASHYPDGWAYEYPAHHAHPAAPAKQAHAATHVHAATPAQHRAPAPAQAPRRGRNPADYTLLHAGRQVRLGPVAFWIVVGTLVIMAGWTLLTGTYFAFHDDVLKRLMASYEAEVARRTAAESAPTQP